MVEPYTRPDFVHQVGVPLGAAPYKSTFSIGARAQPKSPAKCAAENLVTLESTLQRDVQDRHPRTDQSSGGVIDTQPQCELFGRFSQRRTQGSMSMK